MSNCGQEMHTRGRSLTGRVSADASSHALTIEDLVLEALDLEVKGQLATTRDSVSGSLDVAEFNPRELLEALGQSAPQTADEAALTKLSLSTTLSGSPQALSLDPVAIVLDDTRLAGNLGVGGFDRTLPAVTFALEVDRMDADRYLPPAKDGEAPPAATPGAAATQGAGLPVDTLRALDVDGTLKVGEFKVAKLTTSDVLVTVKAKDGVLRLSPIGAKLYDGSYAGNVTLDARKDQPSLALDEKLSGVQAGPLLADLTGTPSIDGTAEVSAKLTAVGADADAMKRTLNGSAAVAFTNGAVNGLNVGRMIREFLAKLKGRSLPAAETELKTDFSEITGTFVVKNGVITNQDLAAKSPLLRIVGKGTVDLPGDDIDYRPTVTVVATTKGQGGDELADLVGVPIPLKVSGPLAAPRYGVDFDKAVEVVAKSQAKDLIGKQLGGAVGGGAAGAALGGLLGGGEGESGSDAAAEGAEPPPAKGVEDAVKGLKGLLGN